MEKATWCGKTVGGGQHKCKWCGNKREFIKTLIEPVMSVLGTLIWFCPNCDNTTGHALPKGDV